MASLPPIPSKSLNAAPLPLTPALPAFALVAVNR